MLTTRSVIKTLKQLKFADLGQLAQENGLQFHSKMTKKEIIQALIKPHALSLKLYGGARTESSSTDEYPLVISKPVEWDKIPETALIEIIKRLSRNDFNRFRRTSKKFNDRIKNLETADFYKELFSELPYVPYVPIVLETYSEVHSIAWSPDGSRLASGCWDGIIRIYEFDPNTETFQKKPSELKGHTPVYSMSWSPDGTRLASGGPGRLASGGPILIWEFDPNTRTFQQNPSELGYKHHPTVYSVAWSSDGTRLASAGTDSVIHIWEFDKNTGVFQQNPSELRGNKGPVQNVAWSPDGTRLASGGHDKIIRIWKIDPNTRAFQKKPSELRGNTDQVYSVAWSSDRTRLASGGEDGVIRIWNFDPDGVQDGKSLKLIGHTDQVYSVAWSTSDGTRLASGGRDGIRIWKFNQDTETFQEDNSLELKDHTDLVNHVAWSPDGTRLASGGRGKIRIWMS